jgi:AcrR family transcriptional regulator
MLAAVQEVFTPPEAPKSAAARLPPNQPSAPRRERKKQQTRDALIRAALELFDAKGYEHTAVREITDAVDVSERTFFRYFANKEDLALSFVRDGADALVEALAARPPGEEPLTALGNAFRDSLRRVSGGNEIYLSALKLIESTPALLAGNLRYIRDHGEAIVSAIAEREGVDPDTDPRPRIIAALFAGLVSLANRDWQASGADDAEAMLAAFDKYAGQAGPELFGHWNR